MFRMNPCFIISMKIVIIIIKGYIYIMEHFKLHKCKFLEITISVSEFQLNNLGLLGADIRFTWNN